MLGLGLDLQVEAEPEEQTAIWSISPKLCQIAQFLWRGQIVASPELKGKNMDPVETLSVAETMVFGALLYVYLLKQLK